MPSSIRTARHKRLAELLKQIRTAAGMDQAVVAKALKRHQPFIANIESGQRRVDVVEFLQLAAILGFDPHEVVDNLLKTPDES